jgi:hypothetical protein
VPSSRKKLDEAFLYSEAIDVTTYGRQRDKLREELTLARIEYHTEAVGELHASGILAFAERILPRASDLWVQTSLGYKQRLQAATVPPGRNRVRWKLVLSNGTTFSTTWRRLKRSGDPDWHQLERIAEWLRWVEGLRGAA